MTKEQIVTLIVNYQVAQGIVAKSDFDRNVAFRMRTMTERQCKGWLANAVKHGFTY